MTVSGKQRAIAMARPWMGDHEVRAAERVIRSGWITQGPEVAAFEAEFARFVDADHACAVSSCTAALHLALRAVGVGPGDEVITVSHSFIATANSIRHCGATPVFVDIERETFNIEPSRIECAITDRTRAILCVHQMGMPCDLPSITGIARRHGLYVVEDAACAIGSEIHIDGAWQRIGRPHVDIACFSFHPRKLLTTGDGGMITTRHAPWDQQCRRWRQHGMDVPDHTRHESSDVIFESYPVLGYNYRMTDIQAAIGREQLKRVPQMVAGRRALADRYRVLLSAIPGLSLPVEPSWARSNWQSYCVCPPAGCDQRRVMQRLLDRGVATRRGVMCAHREAPYLDGSRTAACLAESERARDQCIILPMHHELTDDDLAYIAAQLERACHLEQSVVPGLSPRASVRPTCAFPSALRQSQNVHGTAAIAHPCPQRSNTGGAGGS